MQDKFHKGASVGVEIARTANFTFASTEEMKRWAEGKSPAYIYTRYGNPTLTIAEKKIAALEGAEDAVVTASGMAAISNALLSVLKAGDEVIATRQVYGGTYRMMRDVFPRMGIVVRHVEADLAGIERLVNPRTKALYIETPTNPTLRLVDLHKAVAFAKEWDLISLIDNTFASPVLQKPIEMGFDLVLHSATKYLAGHSDVIAGAAAGREVTDQRNPAHDYLSGGINGPRSGVSFDSGNENIRSARAATVRHGVDAGKISGKTSESCARSLSGLGFASGPPFGEAADARIRSDVGVRFERRADGGAQVLRSCAYFFASGESWRGRVAGGAADLYVSLQYVARGIARGQRGTGNRARFGGAGRCGRLDRGFAASVGVRLISVHLCETEYMCGKGRRTGTRRHATWGARA